MKRKSIESQILFVNFDWRIKKKRLEVLDKKYILYCVYIIYFIKCMKKSFEIDIENWQSLEIENKNIKFCVNVIVEK